jgi:hypothetical protein
VDGPVLSVKYKDGEKKLVVTPQTVVVTYEMGKPEEIQAGTRIFVSAAKKHVDGTLQTPRITYGRNGEGPRFLVSSRCSGRLASDCPSCSEATSFCNPTNCAYREAPCPTFFLPTSRRGVVLPKWSSRTGLWPGCTARPRLPDQACNGDNDVTAFYGRYRDCSTWNAFG